MVIMKMVILPFYSLFPFFGQKWSILDALTKWEFRFHVHLLFISRVQGRASSRGKKYIHALCFIVAKCDMLCLDLQDFHEILIVDKKIVACLFLKSYKSYKNFFNAIYTFILLPSSLSGCKKHCFPNFDMVVILPLLKQCFNPSVCSTPS